MVELENSTKILKTTHRKGNGNVVIDGKKRSLSNLLTVHTQGRLPFHLAQSRGELLVIGSGNNAAQIQPIPKEQLKHVLTSPTHIIYDDGKPVQIVALNGSSVSLGQQVSSIDLHFVDEVVTPKENRLVASPHQSLKRVALVEAFDQRMQAADPHVQKVYRNYKRRRQSPTRRVYVQNVTPTNRQFIKEMLQFASEQEGSIQQTVLGLGFSGLLKNVGGIDKLIGRVAPELFLEKNKRLPNSRHKKKTIEQLMTNALESVGVPTDDRNEQVKGMNKLLRKRFQFLPLFYEFGLRRAARDPAIFEKINSPKTMLEWYSQRRSLDWFDRTQKKYVEAWRMSFRGMWSQGEASQQRALEAITDVLYLVPGFRHAKTRETQLSCLVYLNNNKGSVKKWMEQKGLAGMMCKFVQPQVPNGLEAYRSSLAVLKYYSDHHGLDWFDTSYDRYIVQTKQRQKLEIML